MQDLAAGLREFASKWMPDGTFQTRLSEDMYHNEALLLFLLRHDEAAGASQYDPAQLAKMVRDTITREHIIPQEPNWKVGSQGFADESDYRNHLHMFGNLTLLSKSDNSRCSNKPTHTKMTDSTLYAQSAFAETRRLAHEHGPKGGEFGKREVVARTAELAKRVMERWRVW